MHTAAEVDHAILLDVQARLIRLEADLMALLDAWSVGGVRGMRRAASRWSTDPDRRAFLERGLAELDRHAQATPARPVAGCPHEPACLNAALCLSAR